jgi:HEAT repeat protein
MMRISLLCLGLLLAVGLSGALADVRGKSDVSDIESGILRNAGVETDTASLIEALASHSHPLVRSIAANVLGLRGDEQARRPLFKALAADPDSLVRQAAALALARMGEPSGFAALREFMEKTSDPVNQIFLAARLAEVGDPAGYSYVCEAALSENRALRLDAAESLASFISVSPPKSACKLGPGALLLSLGDDEDPGIRYSMLLFLQTAVVRGLSLEAAQARVKQLTEDPDAKVRAQAEFVLEAWRLEEQERARKPGGLQ